MFCFPFLLCTYFQIGRRFVAATYYYYYYYYYIPPEFQTIKLLKKMQPTGGGGGGGGLARFQSAPATWLEQLLESDEDVIIDPPKPPLLPHHSIAIASSAITAATTTTTTFVDPSLAGSGFLRQNSSPADFLSQINTSDGYFSCYGIPTKANYDDYLSSRDVSLEDSQIKFTTQMSGDQCALLDVEMDKILGDSVPCRVRAKRGFATHPRSIAERVRRTRISDRIRKLQELVPNMDKQTNTADMLEEAVEYVKFLQKQIQDLTDHRNRCTCFLKDQGKGLTTIPPNCTEL